MYEADYLSAPQFTSLPSVQHVFLFRNAGIAELMSQEEFMLDKGGSIVQCDGVLVISEERQKEDTYVCNDTSRVWSYLAVNQEALRAAGNSRNEKEGMVTS